MRKPFYIEQVAAKQCYHATVSTKAAMKEMQLVEEEHEVLEDVGRNPEAKVMEIRYALHLISQARIISVSLVQTRKSEREPNSSSF